MLLSLVAAEVPILEAFEFIILGNQIQSGGSIVSAKKFCFIMPSIKTICNGIELQKEHRLILKIHDFSWLQMSQLCILVLLQTIDINQLMATPRKNLSSSFSDDKLAFSSSFHASRSLTPLRPKTKVEPLKATVFSRFERAMSRKIAHARSRIAGELPSNAPPTDIHEYEYKQFADQPEIQFSPVSLLLLGPILLCINFSVARHEHIPPIQFVFVTMLVTFLYNLVFILRKNRLMPFLPTAEQDNRLKLAAWLMSIAMFLCLMYGWNASGGMIFAIIYESLAGRQGCFYLIIFGVIIAGSITMEWTSPEYAIRLAPSVLFGVIATLLNNLSKNSPYAICNQLSLYLLIASAWLYPFMTTSPLSAWQYLILFLLGFSCYFNLLLIIRLMQTQRTSMAVGVMTGILIISTTDFVGVNSYVACLTIILSILVLIKIQYLDKRK